MLHTILYFLALFSLSTSPNWAKLNQMPVEVLGFWRLGIASFILGLWILVRQKNFFSLNKTKIHWVILSGVLFFLHLATYKFAAKNTSISNTMILFASNPLWASVGAILFFKESLSRRLVICYVLSLVGIYFLVFQNIEFNSTTFKGDVSSLVSAFFYAAYMLTGKKARLHYENTTYAFIQYSICTLCFGLGALVLETPFTGYNQVSWIAVAGLIVLPTFLGHFSFTYLVNHMSLTLMTCGKLLEPVLASIIAYFVFHERLTSNAGIAFFLTAVSVLILFEPQIRTYFKLRQKI